MAINKKDVNKNGVNNLTIELNDCAIIDLFEKEIDRIISEKYKEGYSIKILLEEDWMVERLSQIYIDAGWEVHIDNDDYEITLF